MWAFLCLSLLFADPPADEAIARAKVPNDAETLDEPQADAAPEAPAVAVNQHPDWVAPAPLEGEIPRWVQHIPVPRETVEELAVRYLVKPSQIRRWNNMEDDEQPRPARGKRKAKTLRIYAHRVTPQKQTLEHVVRDDEGWGSIGRAYGVDPSDLRAWNWTRTGRTVEAGETLTIWIDPVVFDAIVHDRPADPRQAKVRAGAHGVGTPQEGRLVSGVRLPEGPGYWRKYPNSAWGTTYAVRATVDALARFVQLSTYPNPLRVGTFSRQRGGHVGGHVSHQSGRDVDIRLPLRVEVPQALQPTLRRVDWMAVYHLIKAFADTGAVQVVFLDYRSQKRLYTVAKENGVSEEELDVLLQYPIGSAASRGLVRHEPGHADHIHVRFHCGPAEPECVK